MALSKRGPSTRYCGCDTHVIVSHCGAIAVRQCHWEQIPIGIQTEISWISFKSSLALSSELLSPCGMPLLRKKGPAPFSSLAAFLLCRKHTALFAGAAL
jgi:hypothetical protein